MDKLVRRLKYIFDEFPTVELVLLYFQYRDKPDSTRAGVFWRDFREPRLITMNRSARDKIKEMAEIYEVNPPDHLFFPTKDEKLINIRK